jgi:hypothetical protein
MNHWFRPILLIVTLNLISIATASATTYYIAANGSDSNSGTSNSNAWAHAPGMPNCASACAAANPQPGDQFIFRGGDTWHFGTGSPLIGGTWNWTWSGSSSNQIYIGVDQSWYSGSAWARPILNGDNPLSTTFVSSCAYDDDGSGDTNSMVQIAGSYVTYDNFEITGVCWSYNSPDFNHERAMLNLEYGGGTSGLIVSNYYCHGWTMTSGADDNFPCVVTFGSGTSNDNSQFISDVFDGSDAPHYGAGDTVHCQWAGNNTVGCASGQGINGAHARDIHYSVFRYLSNEVVTGNLETAHDNLFEYLYPTFASGSTQQHPNIINDLGGVTGQSTYFYNNIMRHTFSTENVYFVALTSGYIFNNVFFDNMNSVFGPLPSGCFRLNAVSNSASNQTVYIYNNTFGDNTCQFIFSVANSPLTAFNGTGNFENNHLIGFSSSVISTLYTINSGVNATVHDNGNEIYQSTSAANGQGYTASNNYAPTANNNATVGAGSNLSSSCSTFSSDSELCGGTSDGVAEQQADGGEIASFPDIAMVPRQSSWDAGAYEFGSGAAPNPPTGLSAVVQ